MERIRALIEEIIDDFEDFEMEDELEDDSDELETMEQDQYADVYVRIENGELFYEQGTNPLANRLLNSFLLEATTLLRKNLDTIYLESGIDFIKATLALPNSEVATFIFEDVVLLNTMVDTYNQALAEKELPQLIVSIGCASFQVEGDHDHHNHDEHECCGGDHNHECCCTEDDHECCGGDNHHECRCTDSEHECDCDEEEHVCECGHHHHHHHDVFEYPIDQSQTAQQLCEMRIFQDLEPMVFSDDFYHILVERLEELPFLEDALEKVQIDAFGVIYHGNIVEDNEER